MCIDSGALLLFVIGRPSLVILVVFRIGSFLESNVLASSIRIRSLDSSLDTEVDVDPNVTPKLAVRGPNVGLIQSESNLVVLVTNAAQVDPKDRDILTLFSPFARSTTAMNTHSRCSVVKASIFLVAADGASKIDQYS